MPQGRMIPSSMRGEPMLREDLPEDEQWTGLSFFEQSKMQWQK
jgi:hypothetical protein